MKKRTFAVMTIALAAITACAIHSMRKDEPIVNNSMVSINIPQSQTDNTRHPYEESFNALSVPDNLKQHFRLNADASQIIVGESGTMISIPDHAFVDANGNEVTGKVNMEVVEGIDNADIIKMNLGTMSDQGPLQTGGMVYVGVTSENGDTLSLAKNKQLDVEIPVHNKQPGMQLWNGEVQKDGSVLWKDPQPMNEGLHAVTLESLTDDSASSGHKAKKQTVSIAKNELSFGSQIDVRSGFIYSGNSRVWLRTDSSNGYLDPYYYNGSATPLTGASNGTISKPDSNIVLAANGNNSVSLVNLSDDKFRNTNISTAEFRSRLPYIKQACDPKIMNCYTDNAKRDLWKSDEAAADTLDKISCPLADVFHEFAKMKQGKIDPKDEHTAAALDSARQVAMRNHSKKVRQQSATFDTGTYGTYCFGMKQMGWANVDCLYHALPGVAESFFNAHVDGGNDNDKVQVSLIVPDMNIFISGYKRPNGDYSFSHGEYEQTVAYPKGKEAYVLAKSGSGDKLKFCLKKFIFGENRIESLTMSPGTENDLSIALGNGSLDSDDNSIIDDWYTKSLKSGWGCLCSGTLFGMANK